MTITKEQALEMLAKIKQIIKQVYGDKRTYSPKPDKDCLALSHEDGYFRLSISLDGIDFYVNTHSYSYDIPVVKQTWLNWLFPKEPKDPVYEEAKAVLQFAKDIFDARVKNEHQKTLNNFLAT